MVGSQCKVLGKKMVCLDQQFRKIHLEAIWRMDWRLASLETGRPIRRYIYQVLFVAISKNPVHLAKVEWISSLTTGRAEVLLGFRNT